MIKIKLAKIFLVVSLFVLVLPSLAFAEANWVMPDLKIPIPGMKILKDMKPDCTEPDAGGKSICTMPWLNEYIGGIYKYAIGVVAILATIVMMVGGVIWITAAGDSGRIGEAKQWMTGAVTGMILVFSSYTILYFVNPDLVKLKPIKVERIVKMEPTSNTTGRHKDCTWDQLSGSQCPSKKSISGDSYCNSNDKTKSPDDSCCCDVAPLSGCSWQFSCSVVGFTESKNKEDCGSNKSAGLTYCCCQDFSTGNDLANRKILTDLGIIINKADCTSPTQTNCTSLSGMRESTLIAIKNLKNACACPITVTGGTELGHADGKYSHGNGYKIDLGTTKELTEYIQKFTKIGERTGDKAMQYRSLANPNVIYALESDHWDVLVQ